MSARLNPYISFGDNAREAMEFYKSVFGGELTVSTFGDVGAPDIDPALVMHAMLETDAGFTLMGADTPASIERTVGNNITVSVSGDDADLLRGYWQALGDGATIGMELQRQMWGDDFGMLTDRFGINWMVNIAGEGAPAGGE